MADIALIWDDANGRADFAVANGDLAMDAGIDTAVIISLFSDRLALLSDTIPDGTGDRRGWWGDTPLPNQTDTSTTDLTGSGFWLEFPALQTTDKLRRLEFRARECLQWMIDDGIVTDVTASAAYPETPPNACALTIAMTLADGTPWSKTFTLT